MLKTFKSRSSRHNNRNSTILNEVIRYLYIITMSPSPNLQVPYLNDLHDRVFPYRHVTILRSENDIRGSLRSFSLKRSQSQEPNRNARGATKYHIKSHLIRFRSKAANQRLDAPKSRRRNRYDNSRRESRAPASIKSDNGKSISPESYPTAHNGIDQGETPYPNQPRATDHPPYEQISSGTVSGPEPIPPEFHAQRKSTHRGQSGAQSESSSSEPQPGSHASATTRRTPATTHASVK